MLLNDIKEVIYKYYGSKILCPLDRDGRKFNINCVFKNEAIRYWIAVFSSKINTISNSESDGGSPFSSPLFYFFDRFPVICSIVIFMMATRFTFSFENSYVFPDA